MAEARRLPITGTSSGIGRHAARRMEQEGHRLTLICRNSKRATETLDWIGPTTRVPAKADLADLEQVDALCATLLQEEEPIDALVLNAGLQYAGHRQPRWSRQGIELTLAVNHLAHQPDVDAPVAAAAAGRRTARGDHRFGGPQPRHGRWLRRQPCRAGRSGWTTQRAGSAMVDGSQQFDADKAYKDSKLCNSS